MRRASRTAALVSVVAVAIGGLTAGPAAAGSGSLELIADDWGGWSSMSADGSVAAYVSPVDGQAYVRDLATGVDTLVSTADGTTGAEGFHRTAVPELSPDGRYVSFTTFARNLDPRDTDHGQDVYLKDLVTGELSLVSATTSGVKGNLSSSGPAPVANDGTVVFASQAMNFPPAVPLPTDCFPEEGSCGTVSEIYAKSLDGTLTLLSLGTRDDYVDAPSGSIFADISADGTKVALGTMDAMTPEDADVFGFPDVYVLDLTTGGIVLASEEGPADHNSFYFPSLSADGGEVSFQGTVMSPTVVQDQVYYRDLSQPATVRLSRTAAGDPADGVAQGARISADGRYVAFSSRATNLHPDDPDGADDIYVADVATGELRLASQTDDGVKGTHGGSQVVLTLDGGAGVVFSTFLKNFDPTATAFDYGWYLKRLSAPEPPPPADGNGDGVVDALQPAGSAAGAFVDASTTPATSGSVVDRGGLEVSVTDAPDAADGVLVTVGPAVAGSTRATVSACGVTLRLAAGTSAILTCGSVIVETLTGTVQAELDGGAIVVTVPAGASARISDTAAGADVSGVSGTGVTATVGGRTTPVAAGASASFAAWTVSALGAPVDPRPVVNSVKAGRAVPLKWHVSDAAGAPVTTLTSATVTVQHLACGLGTTVDEIEQTFAGGSGLQNLGNGDYQLNWKTSGAFAGSCKTMTLDLGGGVVVQADFRFVK